MYARTAELYTSSEAESRHVLRVLREKITPSASRLRGFQGLMVLSCPEKGRIHTTTLWESEETLAESRTDEYYEESISHLISHLVRPPEVETYRVDQLS